MKIYYASQSFYPHIGGVSTYLLNLAKSMESKGNEVVEVHLRPIGEECEADIKGIEIHRVPKEEIDPEIMKEYSKFKEVVYKECHYNQKEFDSEPDKMPGFEAYNTVNEYFGEALRGLLEEGQPDVVHIHDFQLLFAYKYVPRGIPCILTWHIPFIEDMSRELASFLIKHLSEYDKIVFSSHEYIDAAVKLGLPREKTTLIHPIANTDVFRPMEVNKASVKKSFGIPENSKVILCVQRVDPKSGHEQLIRAMPQVLKELPEAKLVFVGGKSMSNKLSKSREALKKRVLDLIKELKVEDSVIWTGTIDYYKLPELYNAADMAALCSKNEGFGLAITEALACGKPVVGTRVGGIPLQVKNGQNGFLVDAGDFKATAKAIVKILKDEKSLLKSLIGERLSEKMSRRALEIVEQKFKIERGVEKHLMLYNELKKHKDEFHKIKYLNVSEIKAIITDLDRTITDRACKKQFDPKDFDKNLLEEMEGLGINLVLATGRGLPFVQKLARKFNIWMCIVAENGAIVYFPLTKKKILIDTDYMEKARKAIADLKLPGTTFGEVIASIRAGDEAFVKRKLGKSLAENLGFIKNVNEIMVLPKDVDKGLGIRIAMRYFNIDLEKTVLIGDGENDEQMFLNPGFKIALANGTEKLKRLANQVTLRPGTKGVRDVVAKLKKRK